MRLRKRDKTRQHKTMNKAVECARERSGGGRTSDLAFEQRRRCAKCVHRMRVLWARLAQPLDHRVAANVDANTCISSRCHIRSRICERSMQMHCCSIRILFSSALQLQRLVLLCSPITDWFYVYCEVKGSSASDIWSVILKKVLFFIEFGILIIFDFNRLLMIWRWNTKELTLLKISKQISTPIQYQTIMNY